MVDFKKPSTQEMLAAHRAHRAERIASAPRPVPPRNVRHLINIGADSVFLYRTQPIRVPPTPALAGLRILELKQHLEVEEDHAVRGPMTRELIALCTKCCRPVGRWRRTLRVLGLWRPFRDISDAELHGISSFLLTCRASASIRVLDLAALSA